jgi:FkbM family methyltransferase
VPKAHLTRIRRARKLVEKVVLVNVIARGLTSLGGRRAAQIKEQLIVTGCLDYPYAKIRLTLDSSLCIGRLGACTKEPETVAWLERCFKPGQVLYDIGANIGAYSLVADAIVKGRCRVYAFEPSFNTFATLSQNILLNGREAHIFPLHVALGATTGLVDFHYSSLAAGASLHVGVDESLLGVSKEHTSRHRLPTLCYSLDDLVEQFSFSPPNHLKIDVDGPELDVLRGAATLLRDPGLLSILVEVDETRHVRNEIPQFIESLGFRCVGKHPRPTPDCYNIVFER